MILSITVNKLGLFKQSMLADQCLLKTALRLLLFCFFLNLTRKLTEHQYHLCVKWTAVKKTLLHLYQPCYVLLSLICLFYITHDSLG